MKKKYYITGQTGTGQANATIKRMTAGIIELCTQHDIDAEIITSSEVNLIASHSEDKNASANYRVAAITNATHLVLVDGWQNCKVATFERTTALFLGITVLTESEISANTLLCHE